MAWRDSLRPASFRGIPFYTEAVAKAGARRGQTYEFPKRDTVLDEDLGRRATRFSIDGYVIGPDHHREAAALERALLSDTPGQLVTPLTGSMRVRCETHNRSERRQEGGLTFFSMVFVEASNSTGIRIGEPTQSAVSFAAGTAKTATTTSADKTATSDAPIPPPRPATSEVIST